MDLRGASYLFTLSALSMTFVGFCAIVIVLYQTVGGELSKLQLFLTRVYIECGFWAAAFCMLPPLLALCGLSETIVWRASSAAIAAVMTTYCATYPRRRSLMATEALPAARWLSFVAITVLVILGLLGNFLGIPFHPGIGAVAVAATWTLVCGAIIFGIGMDSFLESHRHRRR